MKLNDLIPELQALVSEGKLGSIAGEQLAHLTEDNQRALLNVLGEEIERTTVAKAKEYRSVQNGDGEYEQRLRELQEAKERAEKEAEQARQSEQIALSKLEKEQNKEPKIVYKQDKEQLEKLNSQIGEMSRKLEQAQLRRDQLESLLKNEREKTKEFNRIKNELEEKEEELASLSREQTKLKNRRMLLDDASFMSRDIGAWVRKIRHHIYERDGGLQGDKEANRAIESMIRTLEDTINEIKSWREVEISNSYVHSTEPVDVIDADYVDV